MSTRIAHTPDRAIGTRVIVVCALVLVASSMLKFWHPGAILTYLSSMGFEDTDVYLIAVIELTTAALLLFPRTRTLGLFMASAYLGGAVAAHLAIHRFTTNDPFVAFMAMHTHIGTLEPGVLLAALWFGTWLSQRGARDEFVLPGRSASKWPIFERALPTGTALQLSESSAAPARENLV